MTRKTSAILNFLPVAVKHPRKLLKTLLAFTTDRMAEDVIENYTSNRALPLIDLLDLVPNLNETLSNLTFLEATSRVPDIAFIMAMAKRFENCDYLEIGSWRGESILNVMKYSSSNVSIGLSETEMISLGFPKEVIEADGFFIKDNPKIKRVLQNSMTLDFSTLNQKFDLIFVDGDHNYDAVKSDTINVFKLLKDENSIIIWHDCGNTYSDQRPDVTAGILDGTTAEQRKHIYRVSNTLCGIYIKGDIKTIQKDNMYLPDKVFQVSITGNKI